MEQNPMYFLYNMGKFKDSCVCNFVINLSNNNLRYTLL